MVGPHVTARDISLPSLQIYSSPGYHGRRGGFRAEGHEEKEREKDGRRFYRKLKAMAGKRKCPPDLPTLRSLF